MLQCCISCQFSLIVQEIGISRPTYPLNTGHELDYLADLLSTTLHQKASAFCWPTSTKRTMAPTSTYSYGLQAFARPHGIACRTPSVCPSVIRTLPGLHSDAGWKRFCSTRYCRCTERRIMFPLILRCATQTHTLNGPRYNIMKSFIHHKNGSVNKETIIGLQY